MSKYKVVVTARSFGKSSTEPFDILEKNGCEVHKIPIEKPLNAKELIPLIKDADALIAGNDKVTKEVIDAGNKLKVISRYGIGYDNVDIKAAKEKGIVVTNTPNTNNNSVADLTIGLMIAIARNIVGANNTVKSEGWGRVLGKGVIKRAKGFEMDVLCFDVYPDHEFAEKYGAKYCSMEEILQKSDIITIHVPLMESTKNLIGEKELKMMKNTAFLINAARGGIVNEDALYNALSKNIIAGAALDAVEHEPPVGSPLLKLDNVIITPHIGGYTSTAVNNMGVAAANNVVFVLNNEPGAHIVNN